jgi:hypothetical protein
MIMKFGFHERQRISWVAEWSSASQQKVTVCQLLLCLTEEGARDTSTLCRNELLEVQYWTFVEFLRLTSSVLLSALCTGGNSGLLLNEGYITTLPGYIKWTERSNAMVRVIFFFSFCPLTRELAPILEHRADYSVSRSFTGDRIPWTGD